MRVFNVAGMVECDITSSPFAVSPIRLCSVRCVGHVFKDTSGNQVHASARHLA